MHILKFLSLSKRSYVNKNNLFLSSALADLQPDFRITLGCHSGHGNTLTPMFLFICRLDDAVPILTGDTTHVKFKSGTTQTPISNKNGFVSADELHQRSKKTLQGLLPQVNASTLKHLFNPRSVPNTPLHFIFSTNRSRHWDAGCCSPAQINQHITAAKCHCSIRSIPPWLPILSQINLIHRYKIIALRLLFFWSTKPHCALSISIQIPPFPLVDEHLLTVFIPIIFKPPSTSSFHPLHGLLLFLFPSIIDVAGFWLLQPLATLRPIYRTGVKLPSRCPTLYLFNKYPYWIF